MSKGTENRIFVTNVPANATKDDVVAYFTQFGGISDVYLPRVFGTMQHKGIAYITFEHVESKESALHHPDHRILGEQVLVQMCLPKGAGKGAMPGTTPSADRIFITKIPQDTTQDDVQAYFAQFGDWTDVYMPKGNFTAGHKGVCFISYTNPMSVTQVLQTQPHTIGGQVVVVDVAAPRKGDGKGSIDAGIGKGIVPALLPAFQQAHGFAAQPAPTQAAFLQQQPAALTFAPPAARSGPQVPGRLFLTKVAPTVSTEDLRSYFQQFGALNDVFIPSGGKCIAFVGYDDSTIASAVACMGSHEVSPGVFVNADVAVDRPALGSKGQGKAPRFSPY